MSALDLNIAATGHAPGAAVPAPISAGQRSEWLDALRGFALLGILLFNVQVFGGYTFHRLLPDAHRWGEALDPTLDFWVHVFVQGKFYSLFSFLFGLGFALQLQRLERHGGDVGVLRRRLGWLFAFGLAHALLVWFGDILTVYALFGFALLALRGLSQRALLATALCLLASPVAFYLVFLAVGMGDPLAIDPSVPPAQSVIGRVMQAILGGSYFDVVQAQAILYPGGWLRRAAQLALPRILGMFLLGAWAARAGLPRIGPAQSALLKAWLGCAVAFGVPSCIAFAIMGSNEALYPADVHGLLAVALASMGMPLLSLGYVAWFGLYWRRARPRSLLAAAGRTGLSQYLAQSVACVLLFYGFGFALFGRLSYAASIAVALAVYLALAFGARLWLRHHAQGPMEALWRRLSYRATRTPVALAPD